MENIKNRISVRTYDKREIPEDVLDKMKGFIGNIEKSLGYKYRFPIINSAIDGKVGTYGVISGANYYICAIVKKEDHDLVELGYIFEKIILFATSLGLGTCWLGGTFDRKEFSDKVDLKEDEKFIASTPIGFKSEKMSIKDRAMRKMAKSDNRKSSDEIFFDTDLKPLNLEDLKDGYEKALEMIRIGPSASNKQPWRIIKEKDLYHLYLERTPDYAKDLGYDIQLLDMGIAKYHFESSSRENGQDGNWEIYDKHPIYDNLEYISTWIGKI